MIKCKLPTEIRQKKGNWETFIICNGPMRVREMVLNWANPNNCNALTKLREKVPNWPYSIQCPIYQRQSEKSYNTVQYSAIQLSTVQYSTVKYITIPANDCSNPKEFVPSVEGISTEEYDRGTFHIRLVCCIQQQYPVLVLLIEISSH